MSSPFKQLWQDVVGGAARPPEQAAPAAGQPEPALQAPAPYPQQEPALQAPAYQAPAGQAPQARQSLSPPPANWRGPGGTLPLDAVPAGYQPPAAAAPGAALGPEGTEPMPAMPEPYAGLPQQAQPPPTEPQPAQPLWHDPPARLPDFEQERVERAHAAAAYAAAAPAAYPAAAAPPAFVNPHPSDARRSAAGTGFAPWFWALAIGTGSLIVALVVVGSSVGSAKQRLLHPDERPGIAIAQQAEVAYCTKDFKLVLERVLHSCGLSDQTERRGCKPADIKTFAAISDGDFNSLFQPLKDRGGVLMFAEGSEELDASSKKLLEERWFDRKGARYFFVVARASKTGTADKNRALSHRRANSVMFHLKQVSGETEQELNQKVGLLWLGNEYAQLSQDYCGWPHSGAEPTSGKGASAQCDDEAINRSAFVSWVDCRL